MYVSTNHGEKWIEQDDHYEKGDCLAHRRCPICGRVVAVTAVRRHTEPAQIIEGVEEWDGEQVTTQFPIPERHGDIVECQKCGPQFRDF